MIRGTQQHYIAATEKNRSTCGSTSTPLPYFPSLPPPANSILYMKIYSSLRYPVSGVNWLVDRERALKQFECLYRQAERFRDDELKWGDEVRGCIFRCTHFFVGFRLCLKLTTPLTSVRLTGVCVLVVRLAFLIVCVVCACAGGSSFREA